MKAAIAIFIVSVVALGTIILSNPLRRSESHIREQLLAETPIGSNFDQVQSFVDSQGWRDSTHIETSGFLKQEAGKPAVLIGSNSIRAHMGYYRIPLTTDVTVFWGFDDNDKLIDIWVWKTTDGL